jgi:hypothetical protein
MNENFNKVDYKYLKREAKVEKVFTASCGLTEEDESYNGLTVAFKQTSNNPGNRMIAVSVSYCAPEDTFKKKIGKYNAFAKLMYKEQFVQVPLGEYLRDNGPEETGYILLNMFRV